MSNISDDIAYQAYKNAKSKWTACHNDFDAQYQQWDQDNRAKEQACQQEQQQKLSNAQSVRDEELQAAQAKHDADISYLADLENQCNKPKPAQVISDLDLVGGGTVQRPVNEEEIVSSNPTPPAPTIPSPSSPIPGENAQPRTGKSPDFGGRDIITGLITGAAEDVTGNPLPVGAISDQVFAVIVCDKLYARILQLQEEEITGIASHDRVKEITARRDVRRYTKAKLIWCGIAEGRQPKSFLPQTQELPQQTEPPAPAKASTPEVKPRIQVKMGPLL